MHPIDINTVDTMAIRDVDVSYIAILNSDEVTVHIGGDIKTFKSRTGFNWRGINFL
jgi:hypothetical protein